MVENVDMQHDIWVRRPHTHGCCVLGLTYVVHQHQKDGFIICRYQERRERQLDSEDGKLELKVQCGVQFERLTTNESKKF